MRIVVNHSKDMSFFKYDGICFDSTWAMSVYFKNYVGHPYISTC